MNLTLQQTSTHLMKMGIWCISVSQKKFRYTQKVNSLVSGDAGGHTALEGAIGV